MNGKPSPDLLAAMGEDPHAPRSDKLDALRDKATEARDLNSEISDLTARLEDAAGKMTNLLTVKLPEMMDAAGVPGIDLDASGNLPAMSIKLVPFINAGISAKWPDEKKSAAFRYLTEAGHGDLIKTTITVSFPRESREEALVISKMLVKAGVSPEVKESVSSQTLTSWLKEMIEEGQRPSDADLEKIGGYIGRTVKMKELKK